MADSASRSLVTRYATSTVFLPLLVTVRHHRTVVVTYQDRSACSSISRIYR